MSDVAKWAWLAGFFDGEGSVSLHMKRSTTAIPQPYASIWQIVREPLDKAASIVGGGTVAFRSNRKSQAFSYLVYSEDFRRMLKGMIPYLTIKRDRAILALAMSERRAGHSNNRYKSLTRLDAFTVAAIRAMNDKNPDHLKRVEKSYEMTVSELVGIASLRG